MPSRKSRSVPFSPASAMPTTNWWAASISPAASNLAAWVSGAVNGSFGFANADCSARVGAPLGTVSNCKPATPRAATQGSSPPGRPQELIVLHSCSTVNVIRPFQRFGSENRLHHRERAYVLRPVDLAARLLPSCCNPIRPTAWELRQALIDYTGEKEIAGHDGSPSLIA